MDMSEKSHKGKEKVDGCWSLYSPTHTSLLLRLDKDRQCSIWSREFFKNSSPSKTPYSTIVNTQLEEEDNTSCTITPHGLWGWCHLNRDEKVSCLLLPLVACCMPFPVLINPLWRCTLHQTTEIFCLKCSFTVELVFFFSPLSSVT